MATFPTTFTPFASSPLVPPSPKINTPTQGGKITTRKNPTAGFTWTETYLLDPTSGSHQAWIAQVQGLFYAGSVLTNKKYFLTRNLLGAGGTLKISGSGQTGSSIIIYGGAASTTVLKAGDLVQIGTGSLVYALQADCTTDTSGGATMSLVPDVLSTWTPAQTASLTLTPAVSFSCVMLTANFPQVSYLQSDQTIQVDIHFRETPVTT